MLHSIDVEDTPKAAGMALVAFSFVLRGLQGWPFLAFSTCFVGGSHAAFTDETDEDASK